jgi:hypothetical protein
MERVSAAEELGPYLSVAAFCETAIQDARDSAYTLVRLFDQLTLRTGEGVPVPTASEPLVFPATLFLAFKSVGINGKRPAKIVSFTPSRDRQAELEFEVDFAEGKTGANVNVSVQIGVVESGIYWFDIYLAGAVVTRVPLRVVIEPETSEAAPPAAGLPEQ